MLWMLYICPIVMFSRNRQSSGPSTRKVEGPEFSLSHGGRRQKNGGMTPRVLPPKKQPRLPAWYPSLHCSSFADDQLALAKDQIIYVSAGEVVYHLCYHFLSLLFSFLVYHILYKKQVKFLLTPPTGSAGVRLGCPIPRRAAGGNDQRGMGKSA